MYPHTVLEYEFLYRNKMATVYLLNGSIKIIGFTKENSTFNLQVLTIGHHPRRKGLGRMALQFLRPRFKKIVVIGIRWGALPFWLKMKECGLVDHLLTIKEGRTLYLIKRTTKLDRAG
ncbi:MAG: hypothetical protein GX325_03660 [Peptococcaceae bacterium]|nr:hypothetical protein [Peptococcaceae bacterium]